MYQRVILAGRLGRDPELRYTQAGKPVATWTMATDESYTDAAGERQEQTEWHRIVVFGGTAEAVAKYLSKGDPVLVEGRLQTRSWEDRDGHERKTTEIVALNVRFLPGGGGEGSRNHGAKQPARKKAAGGKKNPPPARPAMVDDDDIPF